MFSVAPMRRDVKMPPNEFHHRYGDGLAVAAARALGGVPEEFVANPRGTPCAEGAIRSARADSVCAGSAKPWVLTATILASSIAYIDESVVNVALPAIEADLVATVAV